MKNILKLNSIWKNKWKILQGIRYTWFPNKYVEVIANKRLEICKSNVCGNYDSLGKSSTCVIPGKGCCSLCGCNNLYKVHSLSSYCSLKDQGKIPLWEAELSESEEKIFRDKTGLKNKGLEEYSESPVTDLTAQLVLYKQEISDLKTAVYLILFLLAISLVTNCSFIYEAIKNK